MNYLPQNEYYPHSIYSHRQQCSHHGDPMYPQYQSHNMPGTSYSQGVGRHPQQQQHHPATDHHGPRVTHESNHPLLNNDTSIPPASIPEPPVDHAVMTRSSSTTVTEPSTTKQEEQEPKDTSGSGDDDQEDSSNHNPPSGKDISEAYGSGGGGGGGGGSDSEGESSDVELYDDNQASNGPGRTVRTTTSVAAISSCTPSTSDTSPTTLETVHIAQQMNKVFFAALSSQQGEGVVVDMNSERSHYGDLPPTEQQALKREVDNNKSLCIQLAGMIMNVSITIVVM